MSTNQEQERREFIEARILAVSQDQDWLEFARKTLRRTDTVEALDSLEGVFDHPAEDGMQTVLLISSELVPDRIKVLEDFLARADVWRTYVLTNPHDHHQRVNDKHLHQLAVAVEDRPDNSKALRRLIRLIFS